MEIVIDIPEDVYEEIESNDWSDLALEGFCIAVRKGIILPKGHGDLKDVQDIINRINLNYNNHQSIDAYSLKDIIATTRTVIPADRSDE